MAVDQISWTASNDFQPLPPNYDLGHPPFFYLSAGILYRIFGESPLISRVYTLIFSSLTIYYVYKIGNNLCNKQCAIISSTLLCFSPLFFTQAGMILPEMVVTSLAVITVYYVISEDIKSYLIFASLMALTLESSIFVIFSVLIYEIIKYKNSEKIDLIKRLGLILLPILIFLIWVAYHYFSRGFLFDKFLENSIVFISKRHPPFVLFHQIIEKIFIQQYRIIVTTLMILSLIGTVFLSGRLNFLFNKEILLFSLIIIANIIFFSNFEIDTPRYILQTLPFLFLIFSISIVRLPVNSYIKFFIIPILIILFIGKWKENLCCDNPSSYEQNLEYIDVIDVNSMAVDYLTKEFPSNTTILTKSMFVLFLNQKKSKFTNVHVFFEELIDHINISNIELIVIPLPTEEFVQFKNYTSYLNLSLIKRFNIDCKTVEIFKNLDYKG